MLVVECRLDERIRINGTIEIVLLEVGNDKARLGVESAPSSGNTSRVSLMSGIVRQWQTDDLDDPLC